MRKEMKNKEQFMREVRVKRAKLIRKRERAKRVQDILGKATLGLTGVAFIYLVAGIKGLAIVGALAIVNSYIKVLQ